MLKSQILSISFFHRNRVVETLHWNVSYGYLLSSYKVTMSLIFGKGFVTLRSSHWQLDLGSPENIWKRIIWNIGWWMPGEGNSLQTWKSWWSSKWRQFFVLLFQCDFCWPFFFAPSFHCKTNMSFRSSERWSIGQMGLGFGQHDGKLDEVEGQFLLVGWWSDVDTHRMLMSKMWFHMWSTKQINRCVVMKQPHAPLMRLVWGKLPKFVQVVFSIVCLNPPAVSLSSTGFSHGQF